MRRLDLSFGDAHHHVAGLDHRGRARVHEQSSPRDERWIHFALIRPARSDRDHVRAALDPFAPDDRRRRGRGQHDEVGIGDGELGRVGSDQRRIGPAFHLGNEPVLMIRRGAPDADLRQLEDPFHRQQVTARLNARPDDRHHGGFVSPEHFGRYRGDCRRSPFGDARAVHERDECAGVRTEEANGREMGRQARFGVTAEDRDEFRAHGGRLAHERWHHGKEMLISRLDHRSHRLDDPAGRETLERRAHGIDERVEVDQPGHLVAGQ